MNNDLISRESLKEEIRRAVGENEIGVFVAKRIFKIIDNAPTVEPRIEYESDGILYDPKLFNGCAVCDKHELCPDAFCIHSVNCNAYGIPNFHKENKE